MYCLHLQDTFGGENEDKDAIIPCARQIAMPRSISAETGTGKSCTHRQGKRTSFVPKELAVTIGKFVHGKLSRNVRIGKPDDVLDSGLDQQR